MPCSPELRARLGFRREKEGTKEIGQTNGVCCDAQHTVTLLFADALLLIDHKLLGLGSAHRIYKTHQEGISVKYLLYACNFIILVEA